MFTLVLLLTAAMLWGHSGLVQAQVAHTFSTGNLSYSQNFDGMGATGTTYPTGWTGVRAGGTGIRGAALTLAVSNGFGANLSGTVYNVGTVGNADRALGALASGSTHPAFGASFSNGTGATINSFNISAFSEQWRTGSNSTQNEQIVFEYSFNATGVFDTLATWDSIPALKLVELLTTAIASDSVNGNASANRIAINGTATVNWPSGGTLWIRWRDFDNTGNDGLYALDDMVMTVTTGAAQTTSNVTFQVNMANSVVSANGVRIAGNFQGWNPAATAMTRSTVDTNVWTYTSTFNVGDTIRYKYVNGNAWGQDEQVPAACAVGSDRFYVVQPGNPTLPLVCYGACTNCLPVRQVTFRVDMTGQTVTNPVHIAGSFNGWNATADTMTPQGNNIYARTFGIQEGTQIQYKFLNGPGFNNSEVVPQACGVPDGFSGFNRAFTVPASNTVLAPVQFSSCNVQVTTPTYPVTAISAIRPVDTAGVNLSVGDSVAIYGTVISHNIRPAGMQYVVRDATGGVTIYRASGNFGLGALAMGDTIWAQGVVGQFNGQTQLNVDTVVRIGTGAAIIAPALTTVLGEAQENELIRIDSVQIVSGTWPAAGSTSTGTNVTVRNVSDSTRTYTVRIVASSTNLGGAAPTTPVFSLVGVGGQFDSSTPFNTGYQIFPRAASDVIPVQVVVQTQVTFQVDMDTFTIGAGGVRIAGTFNGWNPASPSAIMTRVGTSSIYTRTFTVNAGDSLQYKFLRDSLWGFDEMVPAACGIFAGGNTYNRLLVAPAVPVTTPAVIFGTCAPRAQALPIRPIALIKTNNATGVADSLGTRQRLTGVLHGRNMYRSTSQPVGVQWILIDGTGGTTVRRAGTTFGVTNWAAGDSVVVEGVVEQFQGLTQVNIDTMFRVATNRTLRTPLVVTQPSEATENEYIQINNLTITSGTWPAANTNGFITVSNGTATFQMFIISSLNVPRWPQPTGPFNLVGFGAQSDASSPFTEDYQIVPMDSQAFTPVIITTPTLNFGRTDTLLTNVTTSFPMFINIANPVNNTAQVKVRWTATPGVTYGIGNVFNTNPVAVSDTITLNVGANAIQTGFSFQTFGNVPVGRTDTITFSIVSATGGLNIGTLSTSRVRISNPVPPAVRNLTIGQIRGNNTNGLADSLGVRVRTRGVVMGFNKRPAGLEFHIFDRTSNAGIGVFRNSGNLSYNVNEGDSIEVVGLVAEFSGLSQINADSIRILGNNIALPAPQVVTAMSENTESRLIRINNLSMVNPAQWPAPGATGSGATVRVTNGVDSFDVRIDNDVTMFGSPAPTGSFDMIGIGGQFTTTTPRVGGFQLLPRYVADLVTSGGGADSIANFALVSPANNTVLTVEGAQSTTVDIRWNAARWTGGSANFTYTWLLDVPTGNFSAPIATLPSNNSGTDTVLTLTYGQIAALLDAAGVPQGSGVDLRWTVRASRTGSTNTKLATQPFNLRLVRGLMSSVSENNALEAMKLYPNPAQGKAYLQYSLQQPANLKLEVINMIGKQVAVEVLHNVTSGVAEIEVANLPEGVYFVRLSNNQMSATRRLVVKH